ncbi:hypothetical protein [Clostridium sp.]|uniref:hypothetical protein n=1 Tax=Clostridium sp. TaxID=1506 RepID=UPI0035A067F1
MAFSDNVFDFINRTNAMMHSFCDNWARELENQAKMNAPWKDSPPWKDRSSHARQSLHGDVKVENKEYTISLSHGVEYGGVLEDGSKPHIIKPKNKKYLYWKGADHPVKLVHHPGTKKYATVGPTMEKNKYKIRDTAIKLWED